MKPTAQLGLQKDAQERVHRARLSVLHGSAGELDAIELLPLQPRRSAVSKGDVVGQLPSRTAASQHPTVLEARETAGGEIAGRVERRLVCRVITRTPTIAPEEALRFPFAAP